MKIERVYTGGWSNAVRGLRHPLESYKRSDSDFGVTRYDDLILDNSEVGEFQQVWLKTNKFKHTLKDYFDFMCDPGDGFEVEIKVTEDGINAISYHRISDRLHS